MASKKLGISTFDLDMRFKDINEARRYAKRLIEHIRYICDKNANKGWSAQAMVGISNIKGSTSYRYNEQTGKVGRPKKARKFSDFELKYNNGNMNVDWHRHIILVSKPDYAFREDIKSDIDKNWLNIIDSKFNNKGLYKKSSNINIIEYFIDQCEEVLFCNYNNTNEKVIPKGYSLKDLYNFYIKSRTAIVYCGKYRKNNNWAEKEKIDNRYNDIKNFYFSITEDKDKIINDEYMFEAKLNIIRANSKSNNDNKVQNIRRVKEEKMSAL